MTLPLERARSRRPITWLTLIGVLLLPAAVGGILVTAFQDPTERLDSMTAAVVNLDEPVTLDGQYTPLGRQLAAGLVEGTDDLDSNLSWVISNEDDAAEGIADGTYQAVVTIPAEFSAAATSAGQAIADGEGTPEQAEITVTTPEDGLIADDLIAQQIAQVAASSMGTMLSEATVDNVLIGFTTIGEQIGEAADGATQLADGAKSAAEGAAEIPTGAQQLADGAGQLSAGAGQLTGGAAQLAGGAEDLSGGLGTLGARTRDAAAGASALAKGLTDGAAALESQGIVPAELLTAAGGSAAATAGVRDGVREVAGGVDQLVAACAGREESDPVCGGLVALQQKLPALTEGAELAATAADGTSGGLTQLAQQAPAQIAAQLREAGTGASTLGSGLSQLAGGIDQAANGASQLGSGARELGTGAAQLGDGVSQLGDGATALADGSGTLADGLGDLADGTGELAEGLQTATTSLPSFSKAESGSLASIIADPVSANSGSDSLFGNTAIPLLATIVLWFGGLASFIALRAIPGSVLTSRRSSIGLVLRGLWPAAALGAGQGLLVALIVQFVADYDAATWWAFAGIAVLAGIAFAAVNQALVAVFSGIGRWVSALIGVFAVATGVISTVPGWLSGIGVVMPTEPALTGLIAASGASVTGLAVWTVLAVIATTVAVALRRTTSARAVLAAG